MDLDRRAAVHAALGDPIRLAVVEVLLTGDRSPRDLARHLSIQPPLLALHLDHLERAGLISRHQSSADRRRKYVRLEPDALDALALRPPPDQPGEIVFVCTRNSARSQLAAALWRHHRQSPATSAGTEPADAVHPGAVDAARRAGLELAPTPPRLLTTDERSASIVTVCDHAHEQLRLDAPHWSIPDPVVDDSPAAFDRALGLIRDRIVAFRPPSTEPLRRTP